MEWFKFNASTWLTGSISFCTPAARGWFIDLCSMYATVNCKLEAKKAARRLPDDIWAELLDEGVIEIRGEWLVIGFILSQYNAYSTKVENGRKGGLKTQKKKRLIRSGGTDVSSERPTERPSERPSERPTEKKRREEKRIEKSSIKTKKVLKKDVAKDFEERVRAAGGKYPEAMILEFLGYWLEGNGTRHRFQDQKYFEIGRRLSTWARRSPKWGSNNPGPEINGPRSPKTVIKL
jgi:hypothetical protein